MITIKRAYDSTSPNDGKRILVDRIWPRGLRKERAHIDTWLKDIAPSVSLRKWFGHDPSKWNEFERRYWEELNEHKDLIDALIHYVKEGPVTLVFAAHDQEHNNAQALRDYLTKKHRL